MDEFSVLFAVRNLFALGNYQIAINELSTSSRLLQSPEAQVEAKVYLYRSYVGQGKYNIVISDITERDPAEVQAIKLLAIYLQAKQKGDAAAAEQAISSSTALLSDGANHSNPTIQLASATIQVNEGFLEEALRILHSRGKNLECAALVIQIYVQMDRIDLARKEVGSVKSWAEDALLAQLIEAWVDLRVGGAKYQDAFYIFEEFAQSNTAATVKLLNNLAVSNLALGRYPEAESQLLEALNKDNNDADTLVNLIVCSNLTSKPLDVISRYVNQLRDVAPQHAFLQDLDLKNSLFDRAAARYAVA
ncbi:hypothetical protein INT44_003773 [Umbelopsis vinacea]|uniref:Coatomer subunit epsilon n=1 Tax=Umbelopsis vinacea TaxID=44442 RepID=A0A8H7PX37_9FUNG|nr:hypothetical protein INT44_003773 [Umbelopsis vinacea]